MALPISGPISFNAINVELGVLGTTTASLNQTTYRTLAGVLSGVISLSNFYGKSNEFTFSITSNQTNANLRILAIAAGWNQTTALVATINSGIYVSSNSTGTAALTVNGSFPNGVQLVNNGLIIGMGGAGGTGQGGFNGNSSGGTAGLAGGGALLASSAISITNNGTIGGGGGGGGGGFNAVYDVPESGSFTIGGGGGGGGRSSTAANSTGGGITSSNINGSVGQAGTVSSEGAGGAGGTAGAVSSASGAAGGTWGSSGASIGGRFTPGAGGYAVSGNSNITWVVTGTRLGSLI